MLTGLMEALTVAGACEGLKKFTGARFDEDASQVADITIGGLDVVHTSFTARLPDGTEKSICKSLLKLGLSARSGVAFRRERQPRSNASKFAKTFLGGRFDAAFQIDRFRPLTSR